MKLKALMLLCLAGAMPLSLWADAPEPPPGAAADIGNRFYVAPLGSYTFTDGGRQTDNGYGGSLAIGKQLNHYVNVELSGQYSHFSPATLYGVGINTLFFPTRGSVYVLGGAGYGEIRSQPGNDSDYGAVLINLGVGWLSKPFHVLGTDVFLRTEALYRLDAHNDRRTGDSSGNGRKDFDDAVLNIGMLIPLGAVPPPPVVAQPEQSAEVVPVEEAPPAAEPEAAPAPASRCVAPLPGQPINLDGCGAGDTIVLRGVNFATDKAVLTVNARQLLDPVADALLSHPAITVEVAGHTDSQGSAAHNQRLSERRAKAVMDYLASRGIAAGRLSSRGYGKDAPIADNGSEDGRALNRRVELKITGGAVTSTPSETPASEPAAGPSSPGN